ncbi:MAG: RNA polymerase sigma factor [Verrucomicrobia bacterium]|nr:RNA polymerase sigma factor [Verrucomicrobiota bacterium]
MVSQPKLDLAILIARSRNGDLEAVSLLLEAEQPRLMAQALAFCGDPELARDLVQETMIAAWKGLRQFDGSCQFFTWLYVILLRQHRRALGWFARRIPLATPEQQTVAARHELVMSAANGSDADLELLRAMVMALPTRFREVIHLRFYAEASEAEIASVLRLSRGTVKSRLHHALVKLRRMKEKMNRLRERPH